MLRITIGRRIIEIQRKSYRMPIQKEGISSFIDRLFGLKAMQVTSRNTVKMSRNISNRFTTHNKVFGILYFISIEELQKKII